MLQELVKLPQPTQDLARALVVEVVAPQANPQLCWEVAWDGETHMEKRYDIYIYMFCSMYICMYTYIYIYTLTWYPPIDPPFLLVIGIILRSKIANSSLIYNDALDFIRNKCKNITILQ